MNKNVIRPLMSSNRCLFAAINNFDIFVSNRQFIMKALLKELFVVNLFL